MTIEERLALALERSGDGSGEEAGEYRLIGNGAWHDAYLVEAQGVGPLVVRLRKEVIYGRREAYDAQVLHDDYAPVGAYYAQASHCWPGICPEAYHYRVEPDLIFTIESYMGTSVGVAGLGVEEAWTYGERVGAFFRAMHAYQPEIPGHGMVVWREGSVQGEDERPREELRQAENEALMMAFERLAASDLAFDRAALRRKLAVVLASRQWEREPVSLVNRDITPENLILREGRFAGLVDPVPVLHNGKRYAAFFLYCYRYLLPALSEAPRYAHHGFKAQAPQLGAMAEGYLAGYAGDDQGLRAEIKMEYFRWLLDSVCDDYTMMQDELSEEMVLRTGGKRVLEQAVVAGLAEMERAEVG